MTLVAMPIAEPATARWAASGSLFARYSANASSFFFHFCTGTTHGGGAGEGSAGADGGAHKRAEGGGGELPV